MTKRPQSDDEWNRQSHPPAGYACIHRFTDLTHCGEASSQPEANLDSEFNWPTHPEIIELLESMLSSTPELQPGKETPPVVEPHSIYIPENYEPSYAYPLVVWFHDNAGTEKDLLKVMPQISDRNYLGVSLRGNVSRPTGFGWDCSGDKLHSIISSVKNIVVSMRRTYHIHSERIYLAGFGAGADVAVDVMMQRPEWFGGVLSLNGTLSNFDKPVNASSDLVDKRLLIATSVSSVNRHLGQAIATSRLFYAAGMKVGTRIYKGSPSSPSGKMLRDIDAWLMDEICTANAAGHSA